MRIKMDIEEEFQEFLKNIPRKVGQLKMDGTPRKMADLDPALQRRNHAVILGYYGFGEEDLFMPTYEALGQRYGDLTREPIRQLIQRNYYDQIDDSLPVATEVAEVIRQQDFWEELNLLEQLQERGLTGTFPNVIGIVDYLKSQGLVEDYVVCLPTLEKVTRGSYFEHETRMVVSWAKLKSLKKDLKAAHRAPHIVFPLCVFGCDFLYEHGFLRIQSGQVVRGNTTLSKTEKSVAAALVGTKLKSRWSEGPPEYFANG